MTAGGTPTDGPPAGAWEMSGPEVRRLPAQWALCLTAQGPYWKLSGPFKRLRAWMGDLGLRPSGPAFGLFYDDPDQVAPEQTRFSLCYPVAEEAWGQARGLPPATADTRPDGPREEATFQEFPAVSVAVLEYRGPAADSPVAYARLAALDRGSRFGPGRTAARGLPGRAGDSGQGAHACGGAPAAGS